MKKTIILHSLMLISIYSCNSQSNVTFTHDIEFEEIGRILRINELKSEINYEIENSKLKFILENEKGKMKLTEYDLKSNKIKLSGFYSEAQKLSIDTAYQEDATNPTNFIPRIIEYYKPIKDSTWSYYNNNGKLTRQEFYNNGKLMDKKEFTQ